MEVYEQLREILDSHPATAPKSKSIDEILHILFTPDEAAVAINMSFKPESVESIARASSIAENDAEKRFESMADKALFFSKGKDGKNITALCRLFGLFEFPFMKGGGTPCMQRWRNCGRNIIMKPLALRFAGNPTPLMRVVAVENRYGHGQNSSLRGSICVD